MDMMQSLTGRMHSKDCQKRIDGNDKTRHEAWGQTKNLAQGS